MYGVKGQITIYVIVAIAIVVLVFLFLMSSTEFEEVPPERVIVEAITPESQPIRLFVGHCMSSIGRRGVEKLASQGGYIDPQMWGVEYDRNDPTSATGVNFFDSSVVPYWFLMFSDRSCSASDCQFGTFQPEFDTTEERSVKSQLERYIEDNIRSCLVFNQDDFDISINGEPLVEVYLRDDDIRIFMELPITATSDLIEQRLTQFETFLDAPLLRMYELGTILSIIQSEFRFLEYQFLDLLAFHSGLDMNLLPPTSAVDFEMFPRYYWPVPRVHQLLEQLVLLYVPIFQVNFEDEVSVINHPSEVVRRFIELSTIQLATEDGVAKERYGELDVSFISLPDTLFFRTNHQGVIQAASVSIDRIPGFGIQEYNVLYNVEYPVIVSITSNEAFNGEGLTLRFALESNIRNSNVLHEGFGDAISFEQPSVSFCQEQLRTSGLITFDIVDAITGEPVVADVRSVCGTLSCGASQNTHSVSMRIQPCINGGLALQADGYQRKYLPLDTADMRDRNIGVVEMMPFIPVNMTVHAHPITKTGDREWTMSAYSEPLRPQEMVFVTLDRITSSGDEFPFSAMLYLPKGQTWDIVELIPGTYEVTGQIIYDVPFTIPDENRRFRTSPVSSTSVLIEGETFDQFLNGGIVLNSNSGKTWTVTADELVQSSQIILVGAKHEVAYVEHPWRNYMDEIGDLTDVTDYFRRYTIYPQVVLE